MQPAEPSQSLALGSQSAAASSSEKPAAGQGKVPGTPLAVAAEARLSQATSRKARAQAFRQAAESFRSGDLTAFYETLAVASFREQEVSVTLASPREQDCPLIGVSDGFERMTGYNRSEIIGRNCRFLNQGCMVCKEDRHRLRIAVRTGRSFSGVLQNRRKNGDIFMNLLHMSTLRIGTSMFIIGIQADVTNAEVDLAKEATASELQCILDAIFAANVNAWATLQAAQYSAAKVGRFVPYTQSTLQPRCNPQQFIKARDAFVSLEHGLLTNHLNEKNTFLDVYDSDADPKTFLLGLRRVYSEAALVSAAGAACQSLLQPQHSADSTGTAASALAPTDEKAKQESDRSDIVQVEARLEEVSRPCADGQALTPKSVGSAGHPFTCTPCSFFCYSAIECNRGEACSYCHMDHPKRSRRRGRKKRSHIGGSQVCDSGAGNADEAEAEDLSAEDEVHCADGSVPAASCPSAAEPPPGPRWLQEQSSPNIGVAPTPDGLVPLLNALQILSPLPAPPPKRGNTQGGPKLQPTGLIPAARSALQEQLRFEYSEGTIVLMLGQMKSIFPFISSLVAAGALHFRVQPLLPRGFALDPLTGVISGVAREVTAQRGSVHIVAAWGDGMGEVQTTILIIVSTPPRRGAA